MMTNDAIVAFCRSQDPDIIYLAIGCAQDYYEPGAPRASPQQYPPCIKALGGRQICILVDPRLEDDSMEIPATDSVTFISLRRKIEWTSSEDKALIEQLCQIAINRQARLIVQDYTGHNIHADYPHHIGRHDPRIYRKVLFDFTYNEGGCFVDLSKVRFLFRDDGTFSQPNFEPFHTTFQYMDRGQLTPLLHQRNNAAWCYVKRLHRIQTGAEEPRDWCTPERVVQYMEPLCLIYAMPTKTDTASLERLMMAYMLDLCMCVGNPMTEEHALDIIRGSGQEYQDTLTMLKGILLDEKQKPE